VSDLFIKINDFDKYVKVDRECVVNEEKWLDLRKLILSRDSFTCVYCGDTDGPFEVDHVMPKSRGGLDVETNLVCACRSCNRSKKDKTPEEWGGYKRG
jgi:5-methylcytosine-specific restriction endonuclease McrA